MTGQTDGHLDRLVKARWLAIGLSQTDLAEVLGAAFQRASKNGNGSNGVEASRLMQAAEALDIPLNCFHEQAGVAAAQSASSLELLLELRLLRAFHDLHDDGARRMLVHLAEQIVKRQGGRRGDAG